MFCHGRIDASLLDEYGCFIVEGATPFFGMNMVVLPLRVVSYTGMCGRLSVIAVSACRLIFDAWRLCCVGLF